LIQRITTKQHYELKKQQQEIIELLPYLDGDAISPYTLYLTPHRRQAREFRFVFSLTIHN